MPKFQFLRTDDGVRLAYTHGGQGPTLIKAATWLSHLEHDDESPVWGHLLKFLASQHRLVRYDERGCGLSDWQVPQLTFESWVRDLEAMADTVGGERFALLGISQGAPIAIAYAVRHPERVTHLVLQGGYARGRLLRGSTRRDAEEAEMMCRLAALGWGRDDPSFRQFFTTQFIPDGTAAQHAWFNELERLSTSPENAAAFMHEFNTIDVMALLPRVRCPTLVLHSRHDVRVPFDEGRLLATHIPGASLVPIESRNHLLLEHEPGWAVAQAAMAQFLPAAGAKPAAGPLASLSARQRELLELMAQGRDNLQIAAALGLSEKTVRNSVSLLFDRLGVASRAMAIVLARESGLGRSAS